ncbi:MAG: cation diffusion facilitator family transporter [Tissierellia bacterium]|nr:cation diffusion facilitator family transporter [Tissierellia bacterium]
MKDWGLGKITKKRPGESTQSQRKRVGNFASLVGLLANLLLALIKVATGLATGSIAIMADGVNNASDMLFSLVTLLSFYITAKPADEDHPYGHARFEYLASFVVAFIILWVGAQLFIESFKSILNPQPIQVTWPVLFILLASILVKLGLWRLNTRLGKRIHSDLLLATGQDALNDVFSTGAVLLSSLVILFTGLRTDGIMGLGVSFLILKGGLEILRSTVDRLLGEGLSKTGLLRLKEKIASYPGVLGVHDLMLHDYGPGSHYLTAHVELDAREDLTSIHELIDEIERDLREEEDLQATLHPDPVQVNDPRAKKIHGQIEKILKEMDPVFDFHDFRIVELEGGQLDLFFDLVMPVKYPTDEDQVKEDLAQRLRAIDPNYQARIIIDRDFFNLLNKDEKGEDKDAAHS